MPALPIVANDLVTQQPVSACAVAGGQGRGPARIVPIPDHPDAGAVFSGPGWVFEPERIILCVAAAIPALACCRGWLRAA